MVVFAVAEDAFETVLKPRLLAAEADLEFVRCVNWRRDGYTDAIRIPDDIPELEERIAAIEAGLLVIDPLLSHLSAKTNSHTDHEVRVALRPLIVLAQNTGCAVLGNGNFSKNKKDGARAAASGSTAFTNVPRIGLAMASDDEDPDVRILEVVKSNIGAARIGRNYRIRAVRIEGLAEDVPVIVLEGASTKNVDDLLLANQDRRRRVPAELVREVILRELESGDKSRMYLDTACKDELGVNPDTVYKSGLAPLRETGRIQAHKEGMNDGWYWSSKMDVERP